MSLARPFRIEICGGIATGKTTLANRLHAGMGAVVFEDFQSNPFFEQFYADPMKVAFETEVTFLLQHYNAIKLALEKGIRFAVDTSLFQDKAYAEVNLSGRQLSVFDNVFEEVWGTLGPPDLVVLLHCDAEEQLRRIVARARVPEQRIKLDYIRSLNRSIDDVLGRLYSTGQVFPVDSGRLDFAHLDDVAGTLVDQIVRRFPAGARP